jgi:hypothetical protein
MVSLNGFRSITTCLAEAIPGAVDMDIYGAFQLCSLGILAAPATVKNSKTYFLDPGRNIIFLWTGLILSGKKYPCIAHHIAGVLTSDQAC